ncbi:BZ3500_MvSof-1268-A1-R1_Chr7-1g09141 [Microbotryum saponariae]|uniref:BZ3500_MvSof-1268-A1-R1_Chr7-1g09141 protein n=1 Tax=Microbotryum saponariae TaxID=289078 RepID=A0A2X0LCT7_9BASI|nr:BZ3501_MvSof-1269-A2-R1_Chr7-1g08846 [Microbotryum saponariae]SDA02880.1 BZ3500_MvSof-1268-A1-R1_Chr7-1g09141 [Microbotryum saponariae]
MRTPAAGPLVGDVTQQSPAFFSSLADFAENRRRPKSQLKTIPYSFPKVGSDTAGKHRFSVCHDYGGGYSEHDDKRGYTFTWWHLIDSFIYFAHHRVSPPPRAWIQAAHRHGVKMLGTFIFEGDGGPQDLLKLLEHSNEDGVPRLTAASLSYADRLIDMCVEHSFEGWLINVEVPFVEGQEAEQMKAMLLWLRYLKDEARRRIGPASAIMWYDAANLLGVAWQNELNDYTLPFANVADSIFLNYWWREKEIEDTTTKVAEKSSMIEMDQVYFGLDVWGRGQFGGGGFASWIALDLLDRVTKSSLHKVSAGTSPNAAYSVAIFAPGWTVESLGHDLTNPKGYSEWFADEAHLWIGTSRLPDAPTPLAPVGKREETASVAPAAIDNANRTAQLTCLASALSTSLLDQISKPLSNYARDQNRPPPNLNGSFWTCFSRGSGHGFFIDGKKKAAWDKGWTDLNMTFPFPCLAIPSTQEGIKTDLVEDEAWFGSCALSIESTRSETIQVPISATDIPLFKVHGARMKFIWKESSALQAELGLFATDAHGPLRLGDLKSSEEAGGWHAVSAQIESDVDTRVTSCGVEVPGGSRILVGSISILADDGLIAVTPSITGVRWASSGERIEWQIDGADPSDDCATPALPALMYTVWYTRNGEEPKLLGATSDELFALSRSDFPETTGRVGVRAIASDGTLGPLALG